MLRGVPHQADTVQAQASPRSDARAAIELDAIRHRFGELLALVDVT